MSDCLFLPLPQGPGGVRQLSGWDALWMSLGEGEAERLPSGRGGGWKAIEVPRQLAARQGRQAIWYRNQFARPDHAGRVLLRFGGAFLATNVWLNGKLLGSHYGYFAPFGFDITPYLKSENLLVVCCESSVETQVHEKRHVMGTFNDGELRPYPSSAYGSLPEPYEWEVPVGLWRPVELEYVGPIAIDWVRLKPQFEASDGRLEVEARLRNLDGREMVGDAELAVMLPGREPVRLHREVRLSGGGLETMNMRLALPGARRWEPWRFGEAVVNGVALTISSAGQESARVEDKFAFRDVDAEIGSRRWSFRVNGRSMFLRGACYSPSYRLDQLTPARFDADLKLARETNLDALRVVANVLPHEFYARADAAGMLVVQDLPLTGAYAYHARNEDARFFENAVREQQSEMVEMLRNRPSVAMWIAHDNPPWIASNADMGDMHSVRQNHTIDQELKASFDSLDGSRPALAASGEIDKHVFLGWEYGTWKDMAEVDPLLVSAFGAQALPSADSAAWDGIGARWPVADDEPAWRFAGFQPAIWAERGVGLPSEHQSLEAYIEASQRYQAGVVRFAAEHLRARKFEPCWGAFAFHLIDPYPGIGFGLVDASRNPKLALAALTAAFRPTRVLIEPRGFETTLPFGILQLSSTPFDARLIVVNDDPDVYGAGVVRWSLSREKAVERGGMGRLRDAVQRKSFSGAATCEVPTVHEPAIIAAGLSLLLTAEGDYRLEAVLEVAGREIDVAELSFSVASSSPPRRPRPELPRYVAERLADLSGLRSEPDGLSLVLDNRTRPAIMTSMTGLRLDGVVIARPELQVDTDSGRAPLPARLELPLGRRVRVHVVTGTPLPPGAHSLEADVTVSGVGSGRLVIEGVIREP